MATNQPQQPKGPMSQNREGMGADNWFEWFAGQPARAWQFPRLTPGQQTSIEDLLESVTPQLKEGQDFGPIAEQRRSQFYEQEVPTLAERFSTMGKGAQRGSGFQQAATQAGAGLQRELSALEQQFGQQKQQQLSGLMSTLLSPQFENIMQKAEPGALKSFVDSATKLAKVFVPWKG